MWPKAQAEHSGHAAGCFAACWPTLVVVLVTGVWLGVVGMCLALWAAEERDKRERGRR